MSNPTIEKIHGPFYGCEGEICREERSWPPEDLQWFRGYTSGVTPMRYPPGFYCDDCVGEALFDIESEENEDGRQVHTQARYLLGPWLIKFLQQE